MTPSKRMIEKAEEFIGIEIGRGELDRKFGVPLTPRKLAHSFQDAYEEGLRHGGTPKAQKLRRAQNKGFNEAIRLAVEKVKELDKQKLLEDWWNGKTADSIISAIEALVKE